MAKRPSKSIEHVSEEAVEIAPPVKVAPVSVEDAIVDLVTMVQFLNENRNYWAVDYMNTAEFKDSALGKLLTKAGK